MYTQLLALKGKHLPRQLVSASLGLCFVVPGKVRMAGPPPWKVLVDHDVLLPAMVLKFVPHAFELADSYQERPRPVTFPLSCPKCHQDKDCSSTSLARTNGWAGLRCPFCKSTCKASRWLCPCAVPWHTCRVHSQVGHDCRPHRDPRLATMRRRRASGVSRRHAGQADRLGEQFLKPPERLLHAPPCKVLRLNSKTLQQQLPAAEVLNLHSLTLHALPIRSSITPGRPLSGDLVPASLHLASSSSSSSPAVHSYASQTVFSSRPGGDLLAQLPKKARKAVDTGPVYSLPRGLKRSLVFQPGPKLKQRLLEIGPSCTIALPLQQVPDNLPPPLQIEEGLS
jgi:hypothetical protein